jgi:hypothetical protein
MEEEKLLMEIARVTEEIDKFIKLGAKPNLLRNEIFFNEKVLKGHTNMCLKGFAYSFNFIVGSDEFLKSTKKDRIKCLERFKEILEIK